MVAVMSFLCEAVRLLSVSYAMLRCRSQADELYNNQVNKAKNVSRLLQSRPRVTFCCCGRSSSQYR